MFKMTLEIVSQLTLLAATLAATFLGFVVVFQAYRAYRRTDSRRMYHMAVGFALLTIVPFVLSLVGTLLTPAVAGGARVQSLVVPPVTRLVEVGGLAVILYSLYSE